MHGLIIAAPSSGAGKTTVTLGLLRALTRKGIAIRSAKSGPDYIDPAFHAAATGSPCVNLDAWAMTPQRIAQLASGDTPLIIEGAMGLFDGAPPDGKGAVADLARQFDMPVVLVVNAAAMSHSVAALVRGFASHDAKVRIAGVILNNIGSPRHTDMLRAALAPLGMRVLGAVPRTGALSRPSRHLGLVQAGEMPDLEGFLTAAADQMDACLDLEAVMDTLAGSIPTVPPLAFSPPRPRTRTLAIARDAAFSFVYPHQIADWTAAGTQITFFSPLADDPVPQADEVFLPGGYPELYAARLARNQIFMQSLKHAAQTSVIYGECGGYMTLGEGLIDADGTRHKMAGLLGLTTSFETRKLHLGYRTLRPFGDAKPPMVITAHEFHYATTLSADGPPLFHAQDATGADLGTTGLSEGRVCGSFMHKIECDPHNNSFASLLRQA
ncbi:cobyrinate a,c-diamide synthase [Pseudooctadecabacter jejudonensis]|uniref:Hydrogenobyrinate a,c-diamide synthase n=1 Tax=Pseudooctadecabacter jejudonensis TaxID=1391910 RepID=A0A1Y5RCY5_9RHOB|nr:cobyrinate a,c-diamide synthase [Pseudooctadecabacter jejudonensis]SLN14566.1 Cobyrinic acid A,C-diamide synthase [Pseudooctadecabacter jejudonensis]